MAVRKYHSKISRVKRVLKGDTKVVVNLNLQLEDEFGGMYDQHKSNAAILPPFNPLTLKALCTRNNILQQCIHAMETNIDGTGYEIADDSQEGKPKGIDPKVQMALAQAHGQTEGPPGTAVDPVKLLDNLKGEVTPNLPSGAPTDPTVAAAEAAAGVEAMHKDKVVPFKKGGATGQPPEQAPGQPPNYKALPGGTNPNVADPNSPPPVDPNADTPEEEAEKKMLDAFFKEPFPNESFVVIRRKVRVDVEQTGNGYFEVIRNLKKEIVF